MLSSGKLMPTSTIIASFSVSKTVIFAPISPRPPSGVIQTFLLASFAFFSGWRRSSWMALFALIDSCIAFCQSSLPLSFIVWFFFLFFERRFLLSALAGFCSVFWVLRAVFPAFWLFCSAPALFSLAFLAAAFAFAAAFWRSKFLRWFLNFFFCSPPSGASPSKSLGPKKLSTTLFAAFEFGFWLLSFCISYLIKYF